jgi:hypothetical protein
VTRRVAYADPPYIGQARKHYAADPNCCEVNHAVLIGTLCSEFPDGWALSLSAPSLREILPLCPNDVRVMAWVKPFASFKPGVRVAYAWEPVIVRGAPNGGGRGKRTVRDWIAANITLRRGLAGAKPEAFCRWLFEVLDLGPDDELVDVFPGSGAVTRAWEAYRAATKGEQLRLDDFKEATERGLRFARELDKRLRTLEEVPFVR